MARSSDIILLRMKTVDMELQCTGLLGTFLIPREERGIDGVRKPRVIISHFHNSTLAPTLANNYLYLLAFLASNFHFSAVAEKDKMVLKLSFACWDYDRMKAIEDARVRPEGIDLTFLNYRVEET